MKKNLLLTILFLLAVPLVFVPAESSANDFFGDGGAVALWSVDNGALTTDSIGTNTLTDNNTVGTDTVDYLEGDASADFTISNSQSLTILDSDLDSGFPLKSGETNGDISVTFWYKKESNNSYAGLFSKWDTGAGARSFYIRDHSTSLDFYIGTNSGTGYELLDNSLSTSAGRWYHVGATFNNTTKAWKLRVWDDTAGSVVLDASGTAANNIAITSAAVAIGASLTSGTPERYFDGLIDEVVVFRDILTTVEIDQIRQGTYVPVPLTTEDKLHASDANQLQYFGRTTYISGDYAIVGSKNNGGSAYIYYFDGVNWIEQQKLIPSEGPGSGSVAISGNYAFIGDSSADGNFAGSGAVYIFYFDGTNWVEQQKLVNNNATTINNDSFGTSIAVSGNYAIICETNRGNHGDGLVDNTLGVAFIYYFDGTNWVEQQQLTASDGVEGFCFYDGVAISGNQAIVGAPLDDVNGRSSGSAYVFSYDGTSWSEQQKLLPSDGSELENFGRSISISGNYAVIGKPFPGPYGIDDSGSAYIFHYDGTNWSEQQKLRAYDSGLDEWFGQNVAMSGDNVIVGAVYKAIGGVDNIGAAYIFHNDGTEWISAESLVASDANAENEFGRSVSISNNKAIIGASYDDDIGWNSGAAYIYTDYSTEWAEVDIDNDGYLLAVDCNDRDASANPGEPEVCNDGKDTDCDGFADINDPDCPPDVDEDNDGYGSIYDCNDNNASVNPGASEDAFGVCSDGEDNECDGLTDLEEPACSTDADSDGYPLAEDCDETKPQVNIGASEDTYELCKDYLDNDCDGFWDFDDPACQVDIDDDGHILAYDCNDNDDSINPGVPEICDDGIDNNCDGHIDNMCPTTTTTLFPPTTTTTLFPPTTTTTLPPPGNDFSGDGNVKALWRVENGALTTDSKGTNTLTDNNTVGSDTIDYQEGNASASFLAANSESLTITDANLDSGFPLKSGESNGDISVTFWYKKESYTSGAVLFSKWDTGFGARSFVLKDSFTKLEFYIGYNSGAGMETLDLSLRTYTGTWYHVGATFNNTTKAWKLRVWDATAGSVVLNASGTATNNISITPAPFAIGASYNGGFPERYFEGLIDEVVVFDDILTTGEIDEIRQKTYGSVSPSTTTTLPPTTTTTTLPSTSTCADIADKGTCNDDPNCEWVGNPKSGTCQDAVSCVPDETPEATCTDGVDNDCDGMTDCDDTADCGGDPACQACVPDQTPEATCTDGVDNDCDGLTDCADTADCGADPACQGGSCDTYTDKGTCNDDPNCVWSGSPQNGTCVTDVCVPDQTPETWCADGVDNDCDGLIDCADTADCGDGPACQEITCDNYTYKESCQINGCTWSNKDKVCM